MGVGVGVAVGMGGKMNHGSLRQVLGPSVIVAWQILPSSEASWTALGSPGRGWEKEKLVWTPDSQILGGCCEDSRARRVGWSQCRRDWGRLLRGPRAVVL